MNIDGVIAKVDMRTRFLGHPLLKFALVGISGTIIKLGALYLLTDMIGLWYLASYGVAFVLSVISNYIWNSRWTFKNRGGFIKYLGISGVTLSLNLGLVYLLTDIVGIWYIFSGAFGVLSAFLINYTLSRKYVWK